MSNYIPQKNRVEITYPLVNLCVERGPWKHLSTFHIVTYWNGLFYVLSKISFNQNKNFSTPFTIYKYITLSCVFLFIEMDFHSWVQVIHMLAFQQSVIYPCCHHFYLCLLWSLSGVTVVIQLCRSVRFSCQFIIGHRPASLSQPIDYLCVKFPCWFACIFC